MGRKLDKVFVVDVESACWLGKPPLGQMNEIIEIGISEINVENLEITNTQGYIVKPEFSKISVFCTELTGLTQEIVDKGDSLVNVCNQIKSDFCTEKRIWASYGEYDRNQFRKYCQIFNAKYPFGNIHWNIKSIASIFYGWPEMGMDKLLEKTGIKLEGKHHCGKDDSYNTANILVNILQKGRSL